MKRLLTVMIIAAAVLLSACQMPQKISEYSDTCFALDTVCSISAGGENAQEAVNAAFEEIRSIQSALDFYDDGSVVSVFNRAAADEEVKLDIHTAAVLNRALEVSEASGGAFDVTIAPIKELWSFTEGSSPPGEGEIKERLPVTGYEKLIFDRERMTLKKTTDGVKIDLGGAAKGYAADRAAAVLREHGAVYALINLGGNVYVFGDNPRRRDGKWQIGIQKPFGSDGEYTQILSADSGAVVTSGTYQRCFTYAGRLYHHVLNPADGYPADSGISGATVKAEEALTADCLSTACLVLGEEKGRALAESFGAELYVEK